MIAFITASVVAVLGAALCLGMLLARRVVQTAAHPRLLRVRFTGQEVVLPESDKTTAAGEYLLRLAGEPADTVRVGPVVRAVDGRVQRTLVHPVERSGPAEGYWSAHGYSSPQEVGEFQRADVPLANGETREAWHFPGDPTHWVVHVQGIRTSRDVTLRTVALAHRAGATSLAITYRGAGDGPPSRASMLGAAEWTELRDAIIYARQNGAARVTVVAWSMGAALALELLKRDPTTIDDLVLICPVSSWPATIEYGAVRAGLPRQAASAATRLIGSYLGAKLLGMPARVDVRTLDWIYAGSLPVPTLIIHSQADEVVPWNATAKLAASNPSTTTLVETTGCPHGFELTVPDPGARSHVLNWLIG